MKLFIKAIQIICILPATVCIPFILAEIVAAGLLDKAYTLFLAVAIGVSILSGVAASWGVIFSPKRYFGTNAPFKRTVQIGLALGAIGGSSVLIWIAKFIIADSSIPDKATAILGWLVFCGPSIALVIFQLTMITQPLKLMPE